MGVTTAPVLGSGGWPAWMANDSKPKGRGAAGVGRHWRAR